MERVPIFRALACEMICSQCLSSVLNLQFVLKVKSVIVDDVARAGWTGNVSCAAHTIELLNYLKIQLVQVSSFMILHINIIASLSNSATHGSMV